MDLKTFVNETLTQIAEGVNEAKAALNENGMQVVSSSEKMNPELMFVTDKEQHRHYVSVVNFEVLLDIETKNKKTGGVGAYASIIAIGRKKENEETSNDVTKVSFSVPLIFG